MKNENLEYDFTLKTEIIQTEKGQAILIPEKYYIDQKEFFIKEDRGVYMFWPLNDPWLPTKNTMGTFPEDFMQDREQPMLNENSERETF